MFLEHLSLAPGGTTEVVRRADSAPARRGDLAPQEVFETVWQRRWVVLCTLVLCVGAAVTYLKLATPLYTATSRVYVTPAAPDPAGRGSLERSKNYLNTQCELLKSTPILGRVAEMRGVKRMKLFAGAGDVVPVLKAQLSVALGNKDDLIEVSLDSTDPEEAAKVVNAVVESYVAYQTAQKRSSATEMLKILRKEKEARERELADQRVAVLKFKQANPALSLQNERGGISVQRLAQLSETRTTAQMEVAEAAAAYEVVRAALSDPVRRREMVAAMVAGGAPAGADRGRAALLADLHQYQLQLTPTRSRLGAGHPSVTALATKIAETERKLAELDVEFVKARLLTLEQSWHAAKRRLAAVEAAYQEQRKEALELSGTAAKLAVLESGVEQAQKLVTGLESRIKELGVDGETGALNVTVLESAVAADKPSKPRWPLVLVAATLLGLVLGSALALVRGSTDRRLRSSQQTENALGFPVLSTIPRLRRRGLFAGKQAGPVAPDSEAADAYRTVRAAICLNNRGDRCKTLAVTSAVKGEGKSTLASNLAAAMARAGERTLIIDADLRRPTQHRAFNVENRTGLSTVLAGRAEPRDTIRPSGVEGLDLLPSGPIPPNPAELLSSRRFGDLVAELSQHYDRIVLDGPPVLGMPDALILGSRCDATLLVVRADVSDRRATEAAYAALVNIGVRSVATVVNGVRRGDSYSRYGRGYYRADEPVSGEPFEAAAPARPSDASRGSRGFEASQAFDAAPAVTEVARVTEPADERLTDTAIVRTALPSRWKVVPAGWEAGWDVEPTSPSPSPAHAPAIAAAPQPHGGSNGTPLIRQGR